MIETRFHLMERPRQRYDRKGTRRMESLTSGTMAGAGSFRCQRCGYVLTLNSLDRLGDCPDCGGRSFMRASLFSAGPHTIGLHYEDTPSSHEALRALVEPLRSEPGERLERLERAAASVAAPGQYLVFEIDAETHTVALTREWTRIGRSLAADVRFDDPTVSRRHALVVRQADGVRVLDDRSLNGVFVNGERIEWRALDHGDEILVGRYRLTFVDVQTVAPEAARAGSGQDPARA